MREVAVAVLLNMLRRVERDVGLALYTDVPSPSPTPVLVLEVSNVLVRRALLVVIEHV